MAISLAVAASASAEWPGLRLPRRHGEKMMTPADFEQADKASNDGKMTAKMQAPAKHLPACARQAAGR